MTDKPDWREWFKSNPWIHVRVKSDDYLCCSEQMYQAFKSRLIEETKATVMEGNVEK